MQKGMEKGIEKERRDNEFVAMLKDIFERGDIRAYVGQLHKESEPAAFDALTPALMKKIQREGIAYLGGSFSTHPPLLIPEDEGENKGKFLMFENDGGPFLALTPPGINPDSHLLLLGSLTSQAQYQLSTPHRKLVTSQRISAARSLFGRLRSA